MGWAISRVHSWICCKGLFMALCSQIAPDFVVLSGSLMVVPGGIRCGAKDRTGVDCIANQASALDISVALHSC